MSSKRTIKLLFILLLLLQGVVTFGQARKCRVVFYNVENLFDTVKDSVKNDDEFTPQGAYHWNRERYQRKLLHISEVLLAVGEEVPPILIGLAEVENERVLIDLTTRTALADERYRFVHQDSPDRRGIDVALLYRDSCFSVLREEFFPVILSKNSASRDILYCKGVLAKRDTLHLFVCHFPSMLGGERQSEWKRVRAAEVVRSRIDSIQRYEPEAMIIVMGDLNGKANTAAQKEILKTKSSDIRRKRSDILYNTGYYLLGKNRGSYRYRGVWQTIDHIIVSGSLLDSRSRLRSDKRLKIFDADFLLQEDKTYYGMKPKPTYVGPRYIGGYSDHLPIYLDLLRRK